MPVTAQLDLKALGKRARMADKGQAQSATGYVSGGTSPLGQRKRLPTHIDASALEHETILVNGGRRGLQLELDPRDLIRLTGARVHEIASARVTTPPVELHVVSDATGETAARLVQALEAQFPDQEFVEIRHPRVESEEDLQLAVNRMKGRARRRRLHARRAGAARGDAHALPPGAAPLLRPARPADRGGRARLRAWRRG